MTPAGIEPATFRIVAQHLNHCATAVPNYRYNNVKFTSLHAVGTLWNPFKHDNTQACTFMMTAVFRDVTLCGLVQTYWGVKGSCSLHEDGHMPLKCQNCTVPCDTAVHHNTVVRAETERDGTRTETRFGLPAKRTSPFKSAGVSVQSTAGSRGVRISGSNAG